jgi:hypothetical protein
MARYDHLPIYRSAMKLAVHLENMVRGFPRYSKYTLGNEMRVQAQNVGRMKHSASGDFVGYCNKAGSALLDPAYKMKYRKHMEV